MNNLCLLSADERQQVEEAKEQTLRLLSDALKKKESLLVDDPKEFGNNFWPLITTDLVKELIRELEKVTFAKNADPEQDTEAIAYVYSGSGDRTIYLCTEFWKKDPESRSQQDTIIHEVSHFLGYGHTVKENSDGVKKSPQSMLCPLTAYSVASALTSDMDHPESYKNGSYPCCGETSRDTVCEKSCTGKILKSMRKAAHLWRLTSLVQRDAADETDSPGEYKDTSVFTGFTVWIAGHSFVHWAEKRSVERYCGRNLIFPPDQVKVHWMGVRGQKWEGLLEQILLMRDRLPAPDIIIIHLGGNDIGKTGTIDLVFQMKKILLRIRRLFPDVRLIFSEIIPRLLWLETMDLNFCEKIRKRINRAMSMFMPLLGGFSFRHRNFEGGVADLYSDAVHLSESGLDFFNMNLLAMIRRALDRLGPKDPNPSGNDTESSGEDTESSSVDTGISNNDTEPSNEVTEPSDEDIAIW